MIDKVEAGKRYKLVDREAYLSNHRCNLPTYAKWFKDDMITVDYVDKGNGFVEGNTSSVIGLSEFGLFELVDDLVPLTELTLPFGELDNQTKKDLVCASIDGAVIEYLFPKSTRWAAVTRDTHLEFWDKCAYRVKPPVSEKDKLIAAAQQKLKEAQEELAKAQGL